jgi:hypothetical protein
MTVDEALREAQKWLDYLEVQKKRADKLQELARLAKWNPKEAAHQMRQMDQQPNVFDGARLADGVRVMIAEIERLKREYEGCYEAFAKLTGACADRDEVIAELRQALERDAEIERLRNEVRRAYQSMKDGNELNAVVILGALAQTKDK